MANLKVVLSPRWLAHLRYHIQLTSEVTLLFLDPFVIKAYAALEQQIELV